jgi:predicted PurR-regulated permease PerM
LAYLFAPVVNFSSRHVNRSLVSLTFAVLFVAVFVSAGLVFIPKIKEYILYIVENIPKYYDDFIKF